jgi:protein TonB
MLLVSILMHVAALIAIVVLSALAPGLLPSPARHLLWAHEAPRAVRLVDIPLPRQPRREGVPRAAAPTAASSAVPDTPAVTPLTAPTGIGPDTGTTDPGGGRPDLASVEQGGGVPGGGLSVVEAPRFVDREPVRLHSGIRAPRKVVDVAPIYPAIARATGIQGIVILEVIIDERGTVTSSRVLRSVTLLDQAALDAVNRWRFEPARLNEEAIPVVMTVTVNFRLDR